MALKDTYFTISEAAKKLNVTRQTISRWIASGKIHGERVGRETIIAKEELHRVQHERVNEAAIDVILDGIRQKLAYKDYKEVIKLRPTEGYLVFSALKKDGTREWLKVPIAKIRVVQQESGYLSLRFVVESEKMAHRQHKKKNTLKK